MKYLLMLTILVIVFSGCVSLLGQTGGPECYTDSDCDGYGEDYICNANGDCEVCPAVQCDAPPKDCHYELDDSARCPGCGELKCDGGVPGEKPPTCDDGKQNGNELGVDCGGICPPCLKDPTCSDGVRNQGETGIDCGGPCKACNGQPTENKWELIGPGGGGFFKAIKYDRTNTNRIYIGGDRCGVYVSEDGGKTWIEGSYGLYNSKMKELAVHPTNGNIVYAATDGGIFKTTNGAQSWEYVFSDVGPLVPGAENRALKMGSVAISPANHDLIFAGSGSSHVQYNKIKPWKVYMSKNAGVNWQDISANLPNNEDVESVLHIAPHPVNENIVYISTTDGAYKTINKGSSWTRIASKTWEITINPSNPEQIFRTEYRYSGGKEGQNVYRSDDGGNTWKHKSSGIGSEAIGTEMRFDPVNPGNLYLGTNSVSTNQIYKSTNYGDSWENIGMSSVPNTWMRTPNAHHIDVYDRNIIFGLGDIFQQKKGTNDWENILSDDIGDGYFKGRGPEFVVSWNVEVDPRDSNKLWLAASDYKLLKSIDGGDSWKIAIKDKYYLADGVSPTASGNSVAMSPTDPDTLFVAVRYQADATYGILLRSTDGGDSWNQVEGLPMTEGKERHVQDVAVDNKGYVWAQTYGDILRSKDNGNSFQEIKTVYGAAGKFAFDPNNDAVVYFGLGGAIADGYNGLFKSTDSGNTWERLATNSIKVVQSIAVDPNDSDVIWVGQGRTSNAGLWKSTDGGKTFTNKFEFSVDDYGNKVANPMFNEVIVDPENSDIIYTAVSSEQHYNYWHGYGVWKSTDGGNTWNPIEGMLHTSSHGFSINPEQRVLYLGVDQRSIYKIYMDR